MPALTAHYQLIDLYPRAMRRRRQHLEPVRNVEVQPLPEYIQHGNKLASITANNKQFIVFPHNNQITRSQYLGWAVIRAISVTMNAIVLFAQQRAHARGLVAQIFEVVFLLCNRFLTRLKFCSFRRRRQVRI